MPQSVYPAITRVDTTIPLDVVGENADINARRLHELAQRLHKQLEQITSLELDEGEI